MSEKFYTTRREILRRGFTLLSAAPTLPYFLSNTLEAFPVDADGGGRKRNDTRILVMVQLAGGNDGLNTVVPYEMDGYYRARRRLAVPAKDVLPLKDGLGLHPAATGLKELYDAGQMAIVQGVGYPNPNRSHFTSMDIWHAADPQLKRHNGWLGRYFDACCTGSDPKPDPLDGIALMQEAPLAMQGKNFTPLAFADPNELAWKMPKRDDHAADVFRKLNNIQGDFPTRGSRLEQFLQRAALDAQQGAAEIRAAISGTTLARRGGGRRRRNARRNSSLANQLQMVARMIAADLPTRIYYVSMGGFDTHSGQAGRHQNLLRQFGDAMRDFVHTLADDKLLDRVCIVTFSEFGRRVAENASGGTDHGQAAPMFLFGSSIRPGLHGTHPSLARLNNGDLAFQVDFRRIYASVLRDWLRTRPQKIVGAGYKPMRLFT